MKTKRMINGFCRFVLPVAAFMLAACEADPVGTQVGQLPDESALSTVSGRLYSSGTPGNVVSLLLTEGTGFVTRDFYYRQTQAADKPLNSEAWVDKSYTAGEDSNTPRILLPETNYEFPDGLSLTCEAGKSFSSAKSVRFHADGLEAGEYVLPLSIADKHADSDDAGQTIYYNLTIREPHELTNSSSGQVVPLSLDDNVYVVGYLDTKKYSPLLADCYQMQRREMRNTTYFLTINLINLQTSTIGYESDTDRAVLNLSEDVRYVLEHGSKYILPLQEEGRKVCLCIEGGGSGLGFCNLTDAQIDDFAVQVKTVVEQYGLDGVNLWDRNAGYGAEGMPAMNTTSYPKLIKALREALGTEKLLTLADYKEPTEYFWDTAATGGIEAGRYLDYAWTMESYGIESEPGYICDPYHYDDIGNVHNGVFDLGFMTVPISFEISSHTHRPIPALDPSKYGCFFAQWYSQRNSGNQTDFFSIYFWKHLQKWSESNIFIVAMKTHSQDAYEGSWMSIFDGAYEVFRSDGFTYNLGNASYQLNARAESGFGNTGLSGYDAMVKDW